jgi:hypothetical protein
VKLNEQIECLVPRGSIASFSYDSPLDILIDKEFHVVFSRTFAEPSVNGKVIAFHA